MSKHEITKDRVLEVLSEHIGADRGIRAADLTTRVAVRVFITPGEGTAVERRIRSLIEDLRLEGHHICAHPTTGYFIAATEQELQTTCEFLYQRAMTSLRQVAAMKRISLPDLRGQLHLPT